MKTKKWIFKILILYFSIFTVLHTALYLMMPFYFDLKSYLFTVFINNIASTLLLIISMFIIYLLSLKKEKTDKSCDIIYSICRKLSIILYFLGLFTPICIHILVRNSYSFILSLITVLGITIFYIFSKGYFTNIIDYSEKNYRKKSNSIAKTHFGLLDNISLSSELVIEILPLIIVPLFLGLNLGDKGIVFIIYIIILCVLSIIYLTLDIRKSINKLLANNSVSSLHMAELDDLLFKINANKKIYDDYITTIKTYNSEAMKKNQISSIETLRRTVDAKDTYTRGHSDRVAEYSVLIGKELKLSDEELRLLRIGGLFHDIGKIGINDNILRKEGKLTDTEYSEIKKHPAIGTHILENSTFFKDVVPIILNHHERFDGKGYPNGLKGDEIPYLARITSVADTFDAMTSKRSYRDSLPLDIVKEEIKKCSGSQFDTNISQSFLNILENNYSEIEKIKDKYK